MLTPMQLLFKGTKAPHKRTEFHLRLYRVRQFQPQWLLRPRLRWLHLLEPTWQRMLESLHIHTCAQVTHQIIRVMVYDHICDGFRTQWKQYMELSLILVKICYMLLLTSSASNWYSLKIADPALIRQFCTMHTRNVGLKMVDAYRSYVYIPTVTTPSARLLFTPVIARS